MRDAPPRDPRETYDRTRPPPRDTRSRNDPPPKDRGYDLSQGQGPPLDIRHRQSGPPGPGPPDLVASRDMRSRNDQPPRDRGYDLNHSQRPPPDTRTRMSGGPSVAQPDLLGTRDPPINPDRARLQQEYPSSRDSPTSSDRSRGPPRPLSDRPPYDRQYDDERSDRGSRVRARSPRRDNSLAGPQRSEHTLSNQDRQFEHESSWRFEENRQDRDGRTNQARSPMRRENIPLGGPIRGERAERPPNDMAPTGPKSERRGGGELFVDQTKSQRNNRPFDAPSRPVAQDPSYGRLNQGSRNAPSGPASQANQGPPASPVVEGHTVHPSRLAQLEQMPPDRPRQQHQSQNQNYAGGQQPPTGPAGRDTRHLANIRGHMATGGGRSDGRKRGRHGPNDSGGGGEDGADSKRPRRGG